MKISLLTIRAVVFSVLLFGFAVLTSAVEPIGTIAVSDLPPEAQQTLALIKQGGPYPYPKDGVTFGNYQHILPEQARGYYHEFTVKTPGAKNRGARRIIVGGVRKPVPEYSPEYFYTGDHYATFQRIQE